MIKMYLSLFSVLCIVFLGKFLKDIEIPMYGIEFTLNLVEEIISYIGVIIGIIGLYN